VLGLVNIALGIPLVLAFVKMPAGYATARKPKSFGEAMVHVGDIVKGALQTRYLVLITVLTSATLAYLWGSSNWLPTYLKEARGFSLKEMGWLASLPQYATVLAVLLGGVIIDRIERQRVPFIFMAASAGVALSVLLAINAQDRYLAAYALIAANFFWGLQSPAIPSTVQYCARPEHVASAFGVVNGIGSLVAGFMPALMGGVISAVSGGQGPSGGAASGFFAGFALLIGTQLVVFACGFVLWLRERRQEAPGLGATLA
jgi:sugar phosphate permease